MKNILKITLAIITSLTMILGTSLKTYSEVNLRNYKPIRLAKGSFLKAINQRDISTATSKVGDVEYFINPCDVFVGESNIFPKNSVYLGEVEEIVEAVEGINAAMKIKIYKVITPDKKELSLDAYIYKNGSAKIGGDLTPVAYYTKMPHYSGNWKKGVIQMAPTSIREMGHPTVIRAGEEVTFIINSDMDIYKPID